MFKLQIIATLIAAVTQAASLDVMSFAERKQCNDDGTWNFDNGTPWVEYGSDGNVSATCACSNEIMTFCCECPSWFYD